MISEITDAICVVDHEGRVVWANGTFHDWFSHHGHMLGKKITALSCQACLTPALWEKCCPTSTRTT